MMLQRVPMRRLGQPEEVVGWVVYPAPATASFVTGAMLAIDGDYLAS